MFSVQMSFVVLHECLLTTETQTPSWFHAILAFMKSTKLIQMIQTFSVINTHFQGRNLCVKCVKWGCDFHICSMSKSALDCKTYC